MCEIFSKDFKNWRSCEYFNGVMEIRDGKTLYFCSK